MSDRWPTADHAADAIVTRWLEPTQEPVPQELLAAVGGHPLVARLLARRGLLEPQQALAFLDPRHYQSPSPYELPGMTKLVPQLQNAIADGRQVRVWGDLDADGQTASAVLYEMLTALDANVDYRLPRHNQGHGLPLAAVQDAFADGVEVLLTCDTGVTDVESIRWAVDHGLVVLVTDHHDVPADVPPAAAIVDSKLLPAEHPMATLAGVGVAYEVARAMLDPVEHGDTLEAMLDLVALGLVVDMVEQVGEVRYLIQRGIERMRHKPRAGIAALAEIARVDTTYIGERHLQFQIGPRVNAAGRLGDAQDFLELLITDDPATAQAFAGRLESLNQDRRARTEALRGQLQEALARDPEAVRQPAIVLEGEGWPEGVLGSAAGELARTLGKPAILIAHHEGGLSTASARSVAGVDIHRAIASQADKLARQGGHPMAAGFAADRRVVAEVVKGILAHITAEEPAEVEDVLELDAELDWSSISMSMAEQLARLRPFGSGNEQPLLLLRKARLERVEPLGSMGEASPHRRLFLSDGNDMRLTIAWFRAGDLPQPGEWIDVAFQLDVGRWRGEPRLDVQLRAWRLASGQRTQQAVTADAFEIVDWREQESLADCLTELQDRYGDALWIWAEGQSRPSGAQSRAERGDRPSQVLALAQPASSPVILNRVLLCAAPQVVVLLPLALQDPPGPRQALALAAGLGQAAVTRYGGVLDYARAEQAVGLPDTTLRTAIEMLVLGGTFIKVGDRLAAGPASGVQPVGREAYDRLLALLARDLREVAAYRRAFASLPVTALLATDWSRANADA